MLNITVQFIFLYSAAETHDCIQTSCTEVEFVKLNITNSLKLQLQFTQNSRNSNIVDVI